MTVNYFSYAQACAISKDYQWLVGKAFNINASIDLVTIVPYSRILQWRFLQELINEDRAIADLFAEDYDGRFDVVAVAKTDDERGFQARAIRKMLSELDMRFPPERYSCLRSRNISSSTLRQLLA